MSELLYMYDFDVESCEAKILSITPLQDDLVDVVLDKTCFYARGGGQDWDMGTISTDNAAVDVGEVRLDESGDVHHVGRLLSGSLSPGDNVKCEVNHERRMVNTRLHSAGHVIDMAVDTLGLDWIAIKGQHYPHLSAVEYTGTWESDRAADLRGAIENQANDFVRQGLENRLAFIPVEEMGDFVRHVPENIPKNKPGRVVIYGDKFGVPCGGTHVKNLAGIGTVKISKLKEKKGIIRVSYEVEGIA